MLGDYLKFDQVAHRHGVSVSDAIRFFDVHYRPETDMVSIFNARERFLKTREGLSPLTLKAYESHTKKLLRPDPNMPVHRFTVEDTDSIIHQYDNLNSRKT